MLLPIRAQMSSARQETRMELRRRRHHETAQEQRMHPPGNGNSAREGKMLAEGCPLAALAMQYETTSDEEDESPRAPTMVAGTWNECS